MYIKPVLALMFKIINFLLHYRSKWFSLFIYLICINIKRALDLLEKLFYLNKNDTLFVDLFKIVLTELRRTTAVYYSVRNRGGNDCQSRDHHCTGGRWAGAGDRREPARGRAPAIRNSVRQPRADGKLHGGDSDHSRCAAFPDHWTRDHSVYGYAFSWRQCCGTADCAELMIQYIGHLYTIGKNCRKFIWEKNQNFTFYWYSVYTHM